MEAARVGHEAGAAVGQKTAKPTSRADRADRADQAAAGAHLQGLCWPAPIGDSPVAAENYNDLKYHYFDGKAGARENSDFPHRYSVKQPPFPATLSHLMISRIAILREAAAVRAIVMFRIVIFAALTVRTSLWSRADFFGLSLMVLSGWRLVASPRKNGRPLSAYRFPTPAQTPLP